MLTAGLEEPTIGLLPAGIFNHYAAPLREKCKVIFTEYAYITYYSDRCSCFAGLRHSNFLVLICKQCFIVYRQAWLFRCEYVVLLFSYQVENEYGSYLRL